MHISEPGCEVKAALEKGILDCGRYARYVEFCNILKEKQHRKYS
jgi:ribosome biogenesis GTPase